MVEISDLTEGDEILWGDRVEPLEVQGHDVDIEGHPELDGVTVESQRGTTYVVHDAIFGGPKVKRKVTPDVNNPNGLVSGGTADNLRYANDE